MIEKVLGNASLLENALDASWKRNEAISQNIANVDTPGYKRKNVVFEELLTAAKDNASQFRGYRTHSKHIPIGVPAADQIEARVIEDHKDTQMRLDGNNVDIDSEMAAMAKNSIQYNTLAQRVTSYYAKLKTVIHEGRG